MDALSLAASLLEAAAARLRRAAEGRRTPVAVDADAPTKRAEPTWGPPRDRRTGPPIHPAGAWRCVRSEFPKFEVGRVYQCVEASDGSWRIRPDCGGSWAPYWSEADQRFCYPEHQLDFEPVGPRIPLRRAA